MVRRATARTCRAALIALAATCLSLSLAAQWPAPESIDLDAVYRIKEEGLQRSKVMETASYLTDVYGPRLTGSPNFRDAASWAQKTLGEWGLAHVHMESWPFGRAWQNQRFVALAVSPQAYPLLGAPVAWTPGTRGPVSGEAVLAVIQSERDFETWRGRLRGKFVLTAPVRQVPARFEPLGRRFTDSDLVDLSKQPAARGRGGPPPGGGSQQEFQGVGPAFFGEGAHGQDGHEEHQQHIHLMEHVRQVGHLREKQGEAESIPGDEQKDGPHRVGDRRGKGGVQFFPEQNT